MSSGLAADHEACAALLRRSGSSFALPIRLLPAEKRRGTTALYAFCRRADDIVDGGEGERVDPRAAEVALDAFAADNCVTLSNPQDKTQTKAQKLEILRWFFQNIASVNRIERLLETVRSRAVESILCVGHQPDVGECVFQACGGRVAYSPGTVACLEFGELLLPRAGRLKWLTDPDWFG